MRRKELAVADKSQMDAILRKARIVRLGLCRDNVPYIVPMVLGYEEGRIYTHAAKEGAKLDIIRANPRVCFEVDIDHEFVITERSCECGVKYRSVIGFGKATIVDDLADAKHGLEVIMRHFTGKTFEHNDRQAGSVAVIRIDIESMTGKTRYKEPI
jgi:uncharacterized protein